MPAQKFTGLKSSGSLSPMRLNTNQMANQISVNVFAFRRGVHIADNAELSGAGLGDTASPSKR